MTERRAVRMGLAATTAAACLSIAAQIDAQPPPAVAEALKRPFSDLKPVATIHVGRTADWVAVTADAVWVGSTGPNAVHRIDPATNRLVATVPLPGEPCAGLAVGFGRLWVPLCAAHPSLAQVELNGSDLVGVTRPGPAGPEGGIAASADSIWLVTDKKGTLVRIDPASGRVRQRVTIPAGAYNPVASDGLVWVSRADGAAVVPVDASSGEVLAPVAIGPGPRFLTVGDGSLWTLNQKDGSLSRVAPDRRAELSRTPLGTPGHGGDITYGAGIVWTTMAGTPLTATDAATAKVLRQWVGPGGDSIAFGHGSIWLTDYHGGTIARIRPEDALPHQGSPR